MATEPELVGGTRAKAFLSGPLATLAGQVASLNRLDERDVLRQMERYVRQAIGYPPKAAWRNLPLSCFQAARDAIAELEARHRPQLEAHIRMCELAVSPVPPKPRLTLVK